MLTFERAYKEYLKAELAKYITDKPLKVSNDILNKPLENDPNEIAAIIRTGPGSKPSVSSYDLTNLTFTITFISLSNNLQYLLGALNSFIANDNGKWKQITLPIYDVSEEVSNDTVFAYKPVFSTPFMVGSQYKLKTANITIDAVNVVMSITVMFTSNASVIMPNYYLEVNGVKSPLVAVIKTDISSVPSYSPSLKIGSKMNDQDFISNTVSMSITMIKMVGDTIHDLLSNEFFANSDSMLSSKTLRLYRGDVSVIIHSYTVTEIHENGIAMLTLTLSR